MHVPNFGGCQGPNFGGCQGPRTGVGGDNSIQFNNIGRVLKGFNKNFKEWRRKVGGERVGDNNILTF